MPRWTRIGLFVFGVCLGARAAARQQISLDPDWRFSFGDTPGAQQAEFADDRWRRLDVPHDWSIAGAFAETNRTGGAGAFLPAGVGWYRKQFTLSADLARSLVFIDFDGVMANSDVWVNGFHLGNRPYGYVSFRYELTGHLRFGPGTTNVLAVRADNSRQPASRWYAGAGIYRHVRLVITSPIHFEHWGVFVSTPKVGPQEGLVHVQAVVTNASAMAREFSVQFEVLDPKGAMLKTIEQRQSLSGGDSATLTQDVIVPAPELWELAHPALYRLRSKIQLGDATADEDSTTFGIRDPRFEPATGFWLNGRNLKLKGVCLHQDAGALGAAVPLGVWERRLELLKQIGCNAIRTAHNPPAPEFLDLCDRLGFLVMDEMFDCWTVGKNPYDYHLYFNDWFLTDTRDIVRRDRNHPCVVVYSAGNEIRDTPKAEKAKTILAALVDTFHQNDPTRPVSQALFRPNASHDYDDGLADLLDVIGQNYRENELLAAYEAKPTRKILGTENGHDRKVWLALRDNPPYAGQFLWTGFDYLGEARRWPVIGAGSGLFDRTGTPYPRAFERQSWWSDRPMIYLVRHIEANGLTPADPGFAPLERRSRERADWTPRDLAAHDETVAVYSNCEEVELLLNGNVLGSQPLPPDASPRTWTVGFEPGTLKALGKNKGQVVASCELRTAGKPAKILLATDRPQVAADWDDLACVRATVVDARGTRVPEASNNIAFSISGPGTIEAVDSGDNSSHESFRGGFRRAYQGECVALIKATRAPGQISLRATASGLAPASLKLRATPSRRADFTTP